MLFTPEQTAKYLIFVEKLRSKSTLNIFNLWGLREKPEEAAEQLEEEM